MMTSKGDLILKMASLLSRLLSFGIGDCQKENLRAVMRDLVFHPETNQFA
jgi:hypothetical protein